MGQDSDLALLRESLQTLERTPCQFWACQGPTLQPIDMVTCYRCATLAKLQQRFGRRTAKPSAKKVRA